MPNRDSLSDPLTVEARCGEAAAGGPCGRRQGHEGHHATIAAHHLDENDDLRAQLAGAVAAVDDAFQVILDALASLHPEPAKRLMETSSYKAFAAYVKRGQSETRGGIDETLAPEEGR